MVEQNQSIDDKTRSPKLREEIFALHQIAQNVRLTVDHSMPSQRMSDYLSTKPESPLRTVYKMM